MRSRPPVDRRTCRPVEQISTEIFGKLPVAADPVAVA